MQRPLYSNLDHARREIRLLTIQDDDDDSRVRCTIRTVSLNDITKLNALSYCWGDPNVTSPVVVDNFVMNVTVNLELALRQFRRSDAFEGEIWIDAICINQADSAEKAQQVPMMKDIYSVSKVFVWLGESDIRTDDFITLMKRTVITVSANAIGLRDSKEMIKLLWLSVTFVSSPWWQRTWTFQEFFLAKEVTFICGPHLCSRTEVHAWFSILESIVSSTDFCEIWKDEAGLGLVSVHPNIYKNATEGDGVLLFEFLEKLISIIRYQRTVESLQRNEPLNLRVALALTVDRLALDPRDKVFALLGLIPDCEREGIQIDYNIEPEKLFHRTVSNFWPGWYFFEGLTTWKLWETSETVPSWVVDFSRPVATFDIHISSLRSKQPWRAQANVQQSPCHLILTFHATTFDTIQFTIQVTPHPRQDTVSFLKDLKRMFKAFNDAANLPDHSDRAYHPFRQLRTRESPWKAMMGKNHPEQQGSGLKPEMLSSDELNDVLLALICEPYAQEMCDMALSPKTMSSLAREPYPGQTSDMARSIISFVKANMLEKYHPLETAWDYFAMFQVFIARWALRSSGFSFFVTNNGFCGSSEARIQAGDQMVIPHGASFPLALRPQPDGNFKMVGIAYISALDNFAELEEYHKMGIFKDDDYNIV